MAFPPMEPVGKIAGMAAIFSFPVPVDLERFTTMLTFKIIDSFSFHLIEVSVPPLVPTFVTAEASRFLLCDLPDFLTAVFTTGRVPFTCHRKAGRLFCIDLLPAAE